MITRLITIAVALLLAVGSFAYGRHRYVEKHSATLTNPFNAGQSTRLSDPFMHRDLLGDWVKDEWVFAIAIPAALAAAGVAFALKK